MNEQSPNSEISEPREQIFDDADELSRFAVAMAERSGRYLDLIAGEADFPVYDTVEFAEAVKRLAVGNPHSRVRLLLLNPGGAIGEGHRLIELALRLTSYMEIRGLAPEFQGDAPRLLIADRRHALQLAKSGRIAGQGWFDAARRARQMTDDFEQLWHRGEPDPNFRHLLL